MQTQCKHPPDDTTENARAERASRRVLTLTAAMTVVEITAGMAYGSMSLLADGWHMATYAAALGITAFAYQFARRHAGDQRYTFGTGKIGVLGGFASAVALLFVTAVLATECILLCPYAISACRCLCRNIKKTTPPIAASPSTI